MTLSRHLKCVTILGCNLLALSAQAVQLETLPLQLNGFATVAAVSTSEDDVSYLNADDSWRFDTDSVAGIQLILPVNDKVSFTTQIVARGADDFDAELEWAYATIRAIDIADVRAGRLRIPFFLISDSLEVGYSYPWIRPPVEVYGQLGFSRFDGADSVVNFSVGDTDFVVQPFFGSTNPTQDFQGEEGELDVTNLWGLNVSLSYDWLTLRIGHTEGDFDITGVDSINQFLMGLQMAGFGYVADRFGVTGRHGKFTGVGLDIQYDDLRVLSEYTQRETDGLIADTTGWYVTVGYRFGTLMPHITLSELETDENYNAVTAYLPLMPMMLAGGTQQFVQMNTVNHDSVTLGLRWDFLPQTALKFEWQSMSVDGGSMPVSPSFSVGPTYTPGDDVDVYSIALDMIF